jgi:hypothetical protein
VRVHHLVRLADGDVGNGRPGLGSADHTGRRDERRHEVCAVVEHQLDCLVVEIDAVLD